MTTATVNKENNIEATVLTGEAFRQEFTRIIRENEEAKANKKSFSYMAGHGARVAMDTTTHAGHRAYAATKHVGGKVWSSIKKASAIVWKWTKFIAKRNAPALAVATAGAVAGGLLTTTMASAAVVGAAVSAATMLAIHALIAKRKKQKMQWMQVIFQCMDAALFASIMPWMVLNAGYALLVAADQAWYAMVDAYIYAAVLFVL